MSLALYRKYRPGTFSEVIGQESIVSALEGSLKQEKIAHAYLFSGPRGTGKTSIARIFAKALGTADVDLYEIDGASNRGIDEIRAIRDAVRVFPFESKYKVYIIDEVHMLTKDAFNALLKTLEEPPPHVIFILATTEAHKLLDTVVSRCQTFAFKQPSEEVLRTVAIETAKKEGCELEPEAAGLIALLGDGSFRDTLGTLQKVLGATQQDKGGKGKKISYEEVRALTGSPRRELVHALVSAIFDKELDKGLAALREAGKANLDMATLTKMLLHTLRTLMLLRYAPDLGPEVKKEISTDELKFLEATLKKPYKEALSQVLLAFLEAHQQLARSPIPELPLELAFVRILGEGQPAPGGMSSRT